MIIRLATWNIAGAHKLLSDKFMDYGEQEVGYFAEQIRKLGLDVVCLQESQSRAGDSLTEKMAIATGMPYWVETKGCPSHIDREYNLTSAIISRIPFHRTEATLLPAPDFELRFTHDNRVVPPYDRYLLRADFENYSIATVHTEPLTSFGLDYVAGEGSGLAQAIDEVMIQELAQPLLFAGDFNTNDFKKSFPRMVERNALSEVFGSEPTRPDGNHTDHIAYSSQWEVRGSGIIRTQSDHYLCWAEFATA